MAFLEAERVILGVDYQCFLAISVCMFCRCDRGHQGLRILKFTPAGVFVWRHFACGGPNGWSVAYQSGFWGFCCSSSCQSQGHGHTPASCCFHLSWVTELNTYVGDVLKHGCGTAEVIKAKRVRVGISEQWPWLFRGFQLAGFPMKLPSTEQEIGAVWACLSCWWAGWKVKANNWSEIFFYSLLTHPNLL